MNHSKRRRAVQIFIGEVAATIIALLGTLAFFESSAVTIVRNVLIIDLLFIVAYIVWIKLFSDYEKMYKSGLDEPK